MATNCVYDQLGHCVRTLNSVWASSVPNVPVNEYFVAGLTALFAFSIVWTIARAQLGRRFITLPGADLLAPVVACLLAVVGAVLAWNVVIAFCEGQSIQAAALQTHQSMAALLRQVPTAARYVFFTLRSVAFGQR